MMTKALTLLELNYMVNEVFEQSFTRSYWLSAEVSEVRENRGHCYMEFVQKDEFSNSLVAKARGMVWKDKWQMLRPYFERTTGQPLTAGMTLLVQVKLTFHPLYGYALNVVDIDPTYTLGDIARRRQEIIQKLRDEGIDQMNKELEMPRLLQRVAVISSATAAGYGDFCNQLNANDKGLVFYTRLFPAMMQGDGVESSVIAALDAIMSLGRPARVQLFCMIDRGHAELPIKATYVGKIIPTSLSEIVSVRLEETDGETNISILEKS